MTAKTLSTIEELETLVQGDWIRFRYGYDKNLWYVLDNDLDGKEIIVGTSRFLASTTRLVSYNEIINPYGKPDTVRFIGSSKLKWWWKYLPWREIVCPFPRPKNVWY